MIRYFHVLLDDTRLRVEGLCQISEVSCKQDESLGSADSCRLCTPCAESVILRWREKDRHPLEERCLVRAEMSQQNSLYNVYFIDQDERLRSRHSC